jgi:hypothetical protein
MSLPKVKGEKFCPKCGEALKKKELCKCKVKEGYADKVIGNILRK